MIESAEIPTLNTEPAFRRPSAEGLVRRWGWTAPPGSVQHQAERFAPLMNQPVGEVAVALKLLDRKILTEALEQQQRDDSNAFFLTYLAENFNQGAVLSKQNMIFAAKEGRQYIDSDIDGLRIHPILVDEDADPGLRARCQELDCILMQIEDRVPLVLFQSHRALSNWESMARIHRTACDIYKALESEDEEVRLAMGPGEYVTGLLGRLGHGGSEKDSGKDQSYLFYAQLINNEDPGQKRLAKILDLAINRGDTDISITLEPDGSGRVFSRIAGDLLPFASIPSLSPSEMLGLCIFSMQRSGANPNNERPRTPMGGKINFKSTSHRCAIRCSFIPVRYEGVDPRCVDISLRLQVQSGTEYKTTLKTLNLNPIVEECIQDAIYKKDGLILLVGPTNSGKSTTIAGVLGEHEKLFGTRRKRVSLEEPVERNISGISQFEIVRGEGGISFDAYLEQLVRHDPDLIFIGEVRDRASAQVAIAASISGHIVLSTTHAKTAVLGYRRLLKLAGDDNDFDLIQALSLIISQRLIKQLCPDCKTRRRIKPQEVERYVRYQISEGAIDETRREEVVDDLPEYVYEANPAGCDSCTGGAKGQIPVNEVLPIPRELKDILLRGADDLSQLDRFRGCTLLDESLTLLKAGRVALEDIFL